MMDLAEDGNRHVFSQKNKLDLTDEGGNRSVWRFTASL